MKDKIYKLLHPKKKVVLFGTICIILSLVYLICLDKFGSPESYPMYLIMTYSLVILVIWTYEYIKVKLKSILESNKYLLKYKTDHVLRHKVSLHSSLVFNALYAVFKLILGVIYNSYWFITFAQYLIVLVIVKASIAKQDLKQNVTLKEEYLKYRNCGVILLFMNIAISDLILVIIRRNVVITYHEYIAIALATYTFYTFVSSIVTFVKYKKYKSPLMSASKIVNVVRSLVSMLSLEIVMLSTFGANNVEFNNTMIISTGMGISGIICVICAFMINKANKWLRAQNNVE